MSTPSLHLINPFLLYSPPLIPFSTGASGWTIAANITTTTTLTGITIASNNGIAIVVAKNPTSSKKTVFLSKYPTQFPSNLFKNVSSTRALVYRNWTNISPTVGTSAAMLLYGVSTTLDGSTILAVGAGGAVYYTSCSVLTTTSGGKPAPTSSCLQVTSLNTVYNIYIRKLTLLHVHFYMPPLLTPFSPPLLPLLSPPFTSLTPSHLLPPLTLLPLSFFRLIGLEQVQPM